MRSGFADKCVPVVSVSGWQAESQKRQLSVRDREDFRCSRSTAARKITIHVRDREDFRCSRFHSCTENYHKSEGQGSTSGA